MMVPSPQRAVQLAYLNMLGYDMSWATFAVVEAGRARTDPEYSREGIQGPPLG